MVPELQRRRHHERVEPGPAADCTARLALCWVTGCSIGPLGRRLVPDVEFPSVNESVAQTNRLIARGGLENALGSSLKVLLPKALLAIAW